MEGEASEAGEEGEEDVCVQRSWVSQGEGDGPQSDLGPTILADSVRFLARWVTPDLSLPICAQMKNIYGLPFIQTVYM